MMKVLPVYVLTAPFPFVLTIMSGMGSGGAQSQRRHTENTVMKIRTIHITYNLSCQTGSKVHVTK